MYVVNEPKSKFQEILGDFLGHRYVCNVCTNTRSIKSMDAAHNSRTVDQTKSKGRSLSANWNQAVPKDKWAEVDVCNVM